MWSQQLPRSARGVVSGLALGVITSTLTYYVTAVVGRYQTAVLYGAFCDSTASRYQDSSGASYLFHCRVSNESFSKPIHAIVLTVEVRDRATARARSRSCRTTRSLSQSRRQDLGPEKLLKLMGGSTTPATLRGGGRVLPARAKGHLES